MLGNLVKSRITAYFDRHLDIYQSDVKIKLLRFIYFKETPKGYWILPVIYEPYLKYDNWQADLEKQKKWIPKKAVKKHAYPDKENAMKDFIKRTKKRAGFLKRDLDVCNKALSMVSQK